MPKEATVAAGPRAMCDVSSVISSFVLGCCIRNGVRTKRAQSYDFFSVYATFSRHSLDILSVMTRYVGATDVAIGEVG